MGYILWTVGCIWLAYAVFIVRFMRNMYHSKALYLRHPKLENMVKYPCAARHDFHNVDELKMYLGAIFLVPIRVFMAVPIVLTCYLLSLAMKLVFNGSLPVIQSTSKTIRYLEESSMFFGRSAYSKYS